MFALAWYGWEEAVHAFEIRKRAAVTPLPAWPVYFLVPLAFGAMTLQFGRQAVGMLRGTIPVDPDIDADDALALGAEPSHQPTIPSENR
jgi:TRAP-type C4-dicarboxylate transport system permease small subunit